MQHDKDPEYSVRALNWDDIDCVLLDMDGTLLDLNYDNHVWNELVPQAYAEHAGIPVERAQAVLLDHMREIHGTIEFYSFDYWSAYTGVDLIATHHQATERLRYRPGALGFLRWLKATGRRSIIATNAHRDSIKVKHAHTDICAEVDVVASSHDFAAPKEAEAFWHALHDDHGYDRERVLFVDDNEPVLDAAADWGIGRLYSVATPDSQKPPRAAAKYPHFHDFAEICPHIGASGL